MDSRLDIGRRTVSRSNQSVFIQDGREPTAFFRDIDRIGGRAENGDAVVLEPVGQPQRGLPAQLHDCTENRSARAFGVNHFEHVLQRQRLEVQAVAGVVVSRHCLWVAVDHDCFVAGIRQRE